MQTKIISGNFVATIDGEISASATVGEGEKATTAQAAIEEAGITYIVQRDGLSKVYKDLVAKGEKRNTVEYADGTASKFAASLEKALEPYGTFTVEVGQHVPGESAAPRAMATAMWEQVKGNDALRGNLGVAAGASDEAGIEACHNFLKGLRKSPEKKAKATA